MSQVLSLRLPDKMVERLELFARRQGNGMTRTKAGVLLLEESLREAEFPFIKFRDSAVGRQPYLKGSGLANWEVIMIVRSLDFNAERMSAAYPCSAEAITAAIDYSGSCGNEIDLTIEDNTSGLRQ